MFSMLCQCREVSETQGGKRTTAVCRYTGPRFSCRGIDHRRRPFFFLPPCLSLSLLHSTEPPSLSSLPPKTHRVGRDRRRRRRRQRGRLAVDLHEGHFQGPSLFGHETLDEGLRLDRLDQYGGSAEASAQKRQRTEIGTAGIPTPQPREERDDRRSDSESPDSYEGGKFSLEATLRGGGLID